jgi:glycosyltransferase involved in cell wall biosynthesis
MPSIAYVLKGYPRVSETFVASEIYRLEQAGVALRLLVIKRPDETRRHPVIDRIRALPEYLPPTTSLSETSVPRWLAANGRPFLRPLARVARRRPVGLARATGLAFAQAVRARRTFWSTPRALYLKELLQAVAVADRLLDDRDVRHLHAHFAHGATTVAWLAAAITGLPFSFTGHAKDIYAPSLNPAGLLSRKLRAARFAITCTEANRRHLQPLANGTPVHRVYHGLSADIDARPDSAAPAGCPPRILGVGRLVRKKGFDVLVHAAALLPDTEVSIVGEDGGEEASLRALIAELGLQGRVRLRGTMTQAEVRAEYGHATVFCLPCRVLEDGDRDGIPNVLVEAMACSVPVVTTGVSAIPELVEDGVNGILVPPDAPDALARAVLELDGDPDRAAALAAAGRATVCARFDGDALGRQLARLFEEQVA